MVNQLGVDLSKEEHGLYVRTGAFLRHPEAPLKFVPRQVVRMHFFWSKGLLWMHLAREGTFSLTTPYQQAEIRRVELAEGQRHVAHLEHVLAYSASMQPKCRWRLDFVSLLVGRYRYAWFDGPGSVYLFALGGMGIENIRQGDADFNLGRVIAFDDKLAQSVSSRASFWSAVLDKQDVVLERFSGTGTVVLQTARERPSVKKFQTFDGGTKLIDYVNAVLSIFGMPR